MTCADNSLGHTGQGEKALTSVSAHLTGGAPLCIPKGVLVCGRLPVDHAHQLSLLLEVLIHLSLQGPSGRASVHATQAAGCKHWYLAMRQAGGSCSMGLCMARAGQLSGSRAFTCPSIEKDGDRTQLGLHTTLQVISSNSMKSY